MKKILCGVVYKTAVLVAALSVAVSAQAAEANAAKADKPFKPDPVVGAKIIEEKQCASCHGVNGQSTTPANPKLAGQHADYLAKQLANFKTKPGAKEAERANPVMAGFAAQLTEEDARHVAAFYAKQEVKIGAAKAGKASAELGQKIYRAGIAGKNVPACAACHGATGAGVPSQYPRLGGQHADYTEAQMVAFRANTRKNSAQMSAIAARLSDTEIKAVSDYIAGLK